MLVFASYREADNLRNILRSLSKHLGSTTLVVVADDTGEDYRRQLEDFCHSAMADSMASVVFNYSDTKSGRGAAVRRAFEWAFNAYPDARYFMEMDSDGSHSAQDIVSLMRSQSQADLLIGSRYLTDSRIVGWPVQRRVFSKLLNLVIPALLGVRAKDLTNGLRRYSRDSVEIILRHPPQNSGFIYLSEVAMLVTFNGLSIEEIPITFTDRDLGESTVTSSEIKASLQGILSLISKRMGMVFDR